MCSFVLNYYFFNGGVSRSFKNYLTPKHGSKIKLEALKIQKIQT